MSDSTAREVGREGHFFGLRIANCIVCLKPLAGTPTYTSCHVISYDGTTVMVGRHDGECNEKFRSEGHHNYRGIPGCVGPWLRKYGVTVEIPVYEDANDTTTERTV